MAADVPSDASIKVAQRNPNYHCYNANNVHESRRTSVVPPHDKEDSGQRKQQCRHDEQAQMAAAGFGSTAFLCWDLRLSFQGFSRFPVN